MTPLRWLLAFVSFAAAAGVALWVIRSHWPEGGVPLGLSWWAHLMALGAVAFELTLRSAKIALSARACGIPLHFGTAARATLGGDFATAITPARVGAEPARYFVLREAGVPAAKALLVLFLELFIELVSLVIIASILLAFLPASGALKGVAAMVGTYATGDPGPRRWRLAGVTTSCGGSAARVGAGDRLWRRDLAARPGLAPPPARQRRRIAPRATLHDGGGRWRVRSCTSPAG